MSDAPPPTKSPYGPLYLGGAVFGAGLIGYLLADYHGVMYGLLGTAVWLFFLIGMFLARLAYFALFLLPPELDHWYEDGFRFLVQNYFSGEIPQDPLLQRPELPTSMRVMRAGVLDSYLVLVLYRGETFSRAAGPGYVKLKWDEKVREIIDLRDHRRQLTFQALTRDGIPVDGVLVVAFHVRRRPLPESDDDDPYHYDPQAIFAVSHYSSFGEGEVEIKWTERVAPLAASLLTAEISHYTLDEVYQIANPRVPNAPTAVAGNPAPLNLEKIKRTTLTQLNKELEPHGIQAALLEVTKFNLPEDVARQRLLNWQVEWFQRAELTLAHTEGGNMVSQLQQARTNAELTLIRNILSRIESNAWGTEFSWGDVVTMATVEALQEGSPSDLAPNLQQSLTHLQQLLPAPTNHHGEPTSEIMPIQFDQDKPERGQHD